MPTLLQLSKRSPVHRPWWGHCSSEGHRSIVCWFFLSFKPQSFKLEYEVPVCCKFFNCMNEFLPLLASVVLKFDMVIVLGDFNFLIDNPDSLACL